MSQPLQQQRSYLSAVLNEPRQPSPPPQRQPSQPQSQPVAQQQPQRRKKRVLASLGDFMQSGVSNTIPAYQLPQLPSSRKEGELHPAALPRTQTRGKEREFKKVKPPSHTKKIIYKDRESKHLSLGEHEHSKDEDHTEKEPPKESSSKPGK